MTSETKNIINFVTSNSFFAILQNISEMRNMQHRLLFTSNSVYHSIDLHTFQMFEI